MYHNHFILAVYDGSRYISDRPDKLLLVLESNISYCARTEERNILLNDPIDLLYKRSVLIFRLDKEKKIYKQSELNCFCFKST